MKRTAPLGGVLSKKRPSPRGAEVGPRQRPAPRGAVMSKTRILFLPCDTRPQTLELPQQLAAVAGAELVAPPLELLNKLNEPGDVQALGQWLLNNAASADAAIITLETLCLGGMIPARRVSTPLTDALKQLELIKKIKNINPDLRIFAYGVVVRVAHDNDPLEEKTYYGQWGAELRQVSECTDHNERNDNDQTRQALKNAKQIVPAEILEDWLATRERNHQLHLAALGLVSGGAIEHLCFTLDDTTPHGLAARDRRRLERRIEESGLRSRANVYPGADEVASTLLARAIKEKNSEATKVFVRYPSTTSEQAIVLYEDRKLGELTKAHLRAAHCVRVWRPEDAEMILAVNAPAHKQAHRQPNLETVDTSERNLWEFLDCIESDVEAGRKVSVADVAYANGAENRFVELLLNTVPVVSLAGFAAWNTAGNTLGSAIAAGVCALQCTNPILLAEANFARLVDDWLYQARVRGEVRELLHNPSPFDLGELKTVAETEIEKRMRPLATELFAKHFAPHLPGVNLEWSGASLAWPRLFTGVFKFRFVTTKGK